MIIHYNTCRSYEEVVPPFSWVPEVIPLEKSIPVESIEDRQVLSYFNVEASPNPFQYGEGK